MIVAVQEVGHHRSKKPYTVIEQTIYSRWVLVVLWGGRGRGVGAVESAERGGVINILL